MKLSKNERRNIRRKQAEERTKKWQSLTPQEQIADLDRRGMRATKQRKRILEKIKNT